MQSKNIFPKSSALIHSDDIHGFRLTQFSSLFTRAAIANILALFIVLTVTQITRQNP